MNSAEVKKLKHGVYRVIWKKMSGGGVSVGAVGSKYNGDRWLCCANWTSPSERGTDSASKETWKAVEKVVLIEA